MAWARVGVWVRRSRLGTEPKNGPASAVGRGAACERWRAACAVARGWCRRRRTSGNENVGWAAEISALADESSSCGSSNMLADEASELLQFAPAEIARSPPRSGRVIASGHVLGVTRGEISKIVL